MEIMVNGKGENYTIFDSIDEYKKFLEDSLEICQDAFNDLDLVVEGANQEAWRAYSNAPYEYKRRCKAIKKAIKAKDYDAARKKVSYLKTYLDNVEKKIRDTTPSNGGSLALAPIATALLIMGESCGMIYIGCYMELIAKSSKDTSVQLLKNEVLRALAAEGSADSFNRIPFIKKADIILGKYYIASAIGYLPLIIASIKSIVKVCKSLKQLVIQIKEDPKKADNYNLYKATMLANLSNMRQTTDKLSELINKKEAHEKKEGK